MSQAIRELAPAMVMALVILAIAVTMGQTKTKPPEIKPTPLPTSAYEHDKALDWAWGVVQGEK